MKVLNLYAGIGGNRKLWEDVEVTAIENNPDIAKIYQDFFPDDKVIVTDAHQYLLDHYKEFDFIWSSPPCPTHSRMNYAYNWNAKKKNISEYAKTYRYPDMNLYQEVILLCKMFKGKYVVENVIPYYDYLIKPTATIGRHAYWSNFFIRQAKFSNNGGIAGQTKIEPRHIYFDLSKYKLNRYDKRMALRNCVIPELGLHIFKSMNNQELKLAI